MPGAETRCSVCGLDRALCEVAKAKSREWREDHDDALEYWKWIFQTGVPLLSVSVVDARRFVH